MSEIILRLPSKGTQYGYVEVRATPEEFGADLSAPESLGRMYQTYVEVFQKGEKAQKAVSGPAHPALAPEVKVEVFAPEETAQRLEEGEKPRTAPEADEMVKQIIENELGSTTVVDETAAPWDSEPPKAQKKPWEKGAPKAPAKTVDLFG